MTRASSGKLSLALKLKMGKQLSCLCRICTKTEVKNNNFWLYVLLSCWLQPYIERTNMRVVSTFSSNSWQISVSPKMSNYSFKSQRYQKNNYSLCVNYMFYLMSFDLFYSSWFQPEVLYWKSVSSTSVAFKENLFS